MASEQTIQFNYDQAMRQANDLLDISKEINKLAVNKLADSIQTIDKNWDGNNSKKFIKKGNTLKGKIEDSAEDLKKISDSIKQMAKKIYDAEMESIRIAKERSYK